MTNTSYPDTDITTAADHETHPDSLWARFWAFFDQNPGFASAVGASLGASRGATPAPARGR